MPTLERIWACALLMGAVAMAVFTLMTWSRGWIRNEEEGEIVHRRDHPRSFAFLQLLQIVAVGILLFVGLNALRGWN